MYNKEFWSPLSELFTATTEVKHKIMRLTTTKVKSHILPDGHIIEKTTTTEEVTIF